MSTAPGESAPRRPRLSAWLLVLIVTPVLSIALSVFLVLCILHFLAGIPSSAIGQGNIGDPRLLRDIVEPFKQDGSEPVTRLSGIVYYPVPYATPPHLTVTTKTPERSFTIVRQDEFGFVWAVDVSLKDAAGLAGALKGARDLQDAVGVFANIEDKGLPKLQAGEALTWEARGIRPFTTVAATPPFQQKGTFGAIHNDSGVEYFPDPYTTPPNLTLDESHNAKIVATTAIGFKWQAIHGYPSQTRPVSWTARGVRATPEQVAEFVKNPPAFGKPQHIEPIEDSGKIAYTYGESGAASFTRPFVAAPNIELPDLIVTEITAQGFKWKHPGAKSAIVTVFSARWTARGVPDLSVGMKVEKK